MGTFVDNRDELRMIIKSLQSHGKQVVFTNGVFDLLHVGHIRSLIDARSRGDFLVIAVNSDRSVKQLKGPSLPVTPLKERVELLCALGCVDYVTVLEETSADDLLDFFRPNIHAKGRDYTEGNVPERDTVLAYGGSIAIVGDSKKHSTTQLLVKIKKLTLKKTKASSASGGTRKKKKVTKKVTKRNPPRLGLPRQPRAKHPRVQQRRKSRPRQKPPRNQLRQKPPRKQAS